MKQLNDLSYCKKIVSISIKRKEKTTVHFVTSHTIRSCYSKTMKPNDWLTTFSTFKIHGAVAWLQTQLRVKPQNIKD